MMRQAFVSVLVLIALAAPPSLGCPVCDTGTGQQVRQGLFDDGAIENLLAVVLPFVIVFGIVAIVHFGPPWTGRNHGRNHLPRR